MQIFGFSWSLLRGSAFFQRTLHACMQQLLASGKVDIFVFPTLTSLLNYVFLLVFMSISVCCLTLYEKKKMFNSVVDGIVSLPTKTNVETLSTSTPECLYLEIGVLRRLSEMKT